MSQITIAGLERRVHERKLFRGTGVLMPQEQAPMKVRITDISASGLGVVAPVNPPPKTIGLIRFSIPVKPKGSLQFDVQVAIMHSIYSSGEDGFKVGLRFVSVPLELAGAIIEVLHG